MPATVTASSYQYKIANGGGLLPGMPPASSFVLPAPLLYDIAPDDQTSGYTSAIASSGGPQTIYLLGLVTLPVQSVISAYHASGVVNTSASFILYGSNNGSAWTTLDTTPTFAAGSTTQQRAVSASYRYFICSLSASSTVDMSVEMTDFRLYDVNGVIISTAMTTPTNLTVSVIY